MSLKLVTRGRSGSLGVMREGSMDGDRGTQNLVRVFPKDHTRKTVLWPFLTFFKSLNERRKLDILDLHGSSLPRWKSGASHTLLFVRLRHK